MIVTYCDYQSAPFHPSGLTAAVAPIAGMTSFIQWGIDVFLRASQGRVGPVVIVLQPSALHGGDLGWAMLASTPCAAFGNMATFVTYATAIFVENHALGAL